MSSQKKGDLEHRAFEEAMSGVRPLQQEKRIEKELAPLPSKMRAQVETDPEPLHLYRLDFPKKYHADSIIRHQGTIAERYWKRLLQGKILPESSLDLHHCRLEQSAQLLFGFLSAAYSKGQRCVLVIHGKGNINADKPVLKNAVAQWLTETPYVMGYTSAPSSLGGAGALLVYLKRQRSS